jgi:hypothetical protein
MAECGIVDGGWKAEKVADGMFIAPNAYEQKYDFFARSFLFPDEPSAFARSESQALSSEDDVCRADRDL